MKRHRLVHVAFVVGSGLLALSLVGGVAQAFRTLHRLPGIAALDSLDEARARAARGDAVGSLREYRVASRLALGDLGAFEEYAQAIGRNGDRPGELAAWLRARAQWPESARVHAGLGYAFLRSQRPDEALASLGLALRMNPFDWAAHAGRGDALRARGRVPEAIEAYQSALRLAPGEAGLRNKLGIAYALAGMREQAKAQFVEALRLDPGTPGAAENIEKLRAGGEGGR